ncbi:hypothetical protein BDW75DRAFT_121043 [Aspergillus navahoensis]
MRSKKFLCSSNLLLSHTHVQHTFQTNTTASLIPLRTYVYRLAFGPVVAAPLSGTYGRRLIYLLMTPSRFCLFPAPVSAQISQAYSSTTCSQGCSYPHRFLLGPER